MAKPRPAGPGGLATEVWGWRLPAEQQALPSHVLPGRRAAGFTPLPRTVPPKPTPPPPLTKKLPTAAAAPRGMLGATKPRARWKPPVATCCRAASR